MPTLAQLQSEREWLAQFVPPNLRYLVERLEAFYDRGTTNIGAYGDTRHLKGYHRSRAWILGSSYSQSRTLSVTETSGNRNGGDPDAISAVDIVVGYVRSNDIWSRVNYAKQHGLLSYVLQVLLERDPWHVHLSIDRAYSNADHSLLFDIITGDHNPGSAVVSLNVEMPVLKRGAEGGHVITAQALLGARGFSTDIDGDFGPHTEEQTRSMQARYGAEAVDGIWGPETWTIGITGEDRL